MPSAETLATYGATNLDQLIEGVNKCWTTGIPMKGPRPQPEHSIKFRQSAFTAKQFRKYTRSWAASRIPPFSLRYTKCTSPS